ncbi:TPA: helix-turn-helix domain-containing protein [Clostridium perfringens]|uniref:helix-turn-helix domain-containing protein n=1 Tax=Clostridium perfringens TaxID=1502 RepID=UPI00110731E4|nr:helix-turn-helix transcriptional regulator [Clostridium perfringens]
MSKLINNAGNLIRLKRKEKGYSTQELAKLLNVSPGLINNIENGKTDTFNLELLHKISDILNISSSHIISDNIKDITLENINISLSFIPLLKSLNLISNNPNWDSKKIQLLLDKLLDDINFYNKILSN